MQGFINRISISRIIFIAISAAALAFAIQTMAAFPRWIVDDAFITFRYAENLATSGELNWNVGENPVEGYTGIALPIFIALAIKIGISPIAAAHFLGVFCYFAGGLLLVLILGGFNPGGCIAALLYFTHPFFFAHAWSGLETMLFTASMLSAVLAFRLRKRVFFVCSILLVSFTRPEGVLLAAVLLALYRPFSLRLALLYLLPCAIYFLWRWHYYGQLMPNTFYAKGMPNMQQLSHNRVLLKTFFYASVINPLALGLLFIAFVDRRKIAPWMIAIAGFVCVVVVFYLRSNLVMDYSYRFFVPFYPFMLLAVAGLLNGAGTNLKFLPALLVLVLPQIGRHASEITVEKSHYTCYRELLQSEHITIGKYLRQAVPPNQVLIVYGDAGAIPYYSKLRTVDFGQLNDEYLARRRPDLAARSEYFFSRNAGVAVITSYRKDKLERDKELEHITRDPRFNRFALVKVFESGCNRDYFEFVYFRKDMPTFGSQNKD
jgi:arabinofuranosyltransferase